MSDFKTPEPHGQGPQKIAVIAVPALPLIDQLAEKRLGENLPVEKNLQRSEVPNQVSRGAPQPFLIVHHDGANTCGVFITNLA